MHRNGRAWNKAVVEACSVWLVLVSLASLRAEEAGLRFEPYNLQTADGIRIACQLGRLLVPERHDRPDGRQIELAFLRINSTAINPGPPIVYLAGGPGGSGIALARGPRAPVILALRELGDVIALDQRGTGLTRPDLTCQEKLDFPLARPGDIEGLIRAYEKALTTCAARLRSQGVDLTAYNAEENADDLESLRRALRAEKISLFGSSYGSHLGLAGFSKSQHILIEGAGHGNELFVSSPRIKEVILEFMKTGNVSDHRIVLPPIQFKEISTSSIP